MIDLDGMGNHLLIAVMAFTYVVINHSMMLGLFPLISALEWRGMARKEPAWDQLAKRISLIALVINCSLGVLSGVGINLSSSLIVPSELGSPMRLFFWNWVAEWSVFIAQLILIVSYCVTWDSWQGSKKRRHMALGFGLAVFSWIAMFVIVSVIGFVISTGNWAIGNPLPSATVYRLFLPQLLFRTFFALASGGIFVWILSFWLVDRQSAQRASVVRFLALWTFAVSPVCAATAYWFWAVLPIEAANNIAVGSLASGFTLWQSQFFIITTVMSGSIMVTAAWGWKRPLALPRMAIVAVFLLTIGWLWHFEKAREFIRKPFLVADYMYSNGVRVDELALLQHEGVLLHSVHSELTPITDANRAQAGQQVFAMTCARCHTTHGLAGVVGKLDSLYGPEPWNPKEIETLIGSMYNKRTYMPPFPGNADESRALVAYLSGLQKIPVSADQSSSVAQQP